MKRRGKKYEPAQLEMNDYVFLNHEEFDRIIVEGNDGTGKSTLVAKLKKDLPNKEILDRSFLTKLTDENNEKAMLDAIAMNHKEKTLYLVLHANPLKSQKALLRAGKDITEQYHTLEDLSHYHERYRLVSRLVRSYIRLFDNTSFLVYIKGLKDNVLVRDENLVFNEKKKATKEWDKVQKSYGKA